MAAPIRRSEDAPSPVPVQNEAFPDESHESRSSSPGTGGDTGSVRVQSDPHARDPFDDGFTGPSASNGIKFEEAGHDKAKVERARSSASVQEGSVLEKLKTNPDKVGPAVVNKVKTAAHRIRFDSTKASGVSKYLNPTNVRTRVRLGDDSLSNEDLSLLWRARDSRKGRNSISVPPLEAMDDAPPLPLRYTPHLRATANGIGGIFWKMITTFPYWDMAFWSGWSYTFGSALFIVDGVLAWGPVAYENWPLPESAVTYGGPLSFFFGAILYQIGAVAAYLEAVNDGSFHGAGMRRLLEGHDEDDKRMLDEKIGHFFADLNPMHHDAGKQQQTSAPRRGGMDMGGDEKEARHVNPYMGWRWYPTWHALRTHHVYEIGFLACAIQLFGVTLYGITAIVVLPGILSSLQPWQEFGAYWSPQVVAAACFLIASLMFMLETQEQWWKAEPGVMGWWIGVWATVGSVGFELIAIFGIILTLNPESPWAEYQCDLATIWGSSAYFMCSFLQWYEALDKDPVSELLNEPGEMKSSQIHPI